MNFLIVSLNGRYYGCFRSMGSFMRQALSENHAFYKATFGEPLKGKDSRGDATIWEIDRHAFHEECILAVLVHEDKSICQIMPLLDYAKLRAFGAIDGSHATYLAEIPK